MERSSSAACRPAASDHRHRSRHGLKGQTSGALSYEGETVEAEMRIAASGAIEGVVLLPDGVTPAANVTVRNNTSGQVTLVDPATGAFHFIELAAEPFLFPAGDGKYPAACRHRPGHHRWRRRGSAAHIVLRGVGTIEGTLRHRRHHSPRRRQRESAGERVVSVSYVGFSDQDGHYRFTNVPAGSFTLRATHPQRSRRRRPPAPCSRTGRASTADMVLGEVGSVVGKVLMPDGVTPVGGGIARFSGGGRSFTAVIGAEGTFSFMNIPLCSFTINFEDPSGPAINKVSGALTVNGQMVDVGTIVLDDKPIAVVQVDPAAGMVDVPVTQSIRISFRSPPRQARSPPRR